MPFEKLELPITYEALSVLPSANELQKVSPEDGIIRSNVSVTKDEVYKILLTFRKTREI